MLPPCLYLAKPNFFRNKNFLVHYIISVLDSNSIHTISQIGNINIGSYILNALNNAAIKIHDGDIQHS